MAGKPSVMTATKIKEFKDAFSMGFSNLEACLYCEVPERTFYDYCTKHPDFKELIPTLQNMPKLKAKMNILTKLKEGDDFNSRWLLEKTDAEYNPKQIIDSTVEMLVEEKAVDKLNNLVGSD